MFFIFQINLLILFDIVILSVILLFCFKVRCFKWLWLIGQGIFATV